MRQQPSDGRQLLRGEGGELPKGVRDEAAPSPRPPSPAGHIGGHRQHAGVVPRGAQEGIRAHGPEGLRWGGTALHLNAVVLSLPKKKKIINKKKKTINFFILTMEIRPIYFSVEAEKINRPTLRGINMLKEKNSYKLLAILKVII